MARKRAEVSHFDQKERRTPTDRRHVQVELQTWIGCQRFACQLSLVALHGVSCWAKAADMLHGVRSNSSSSEVAGRCRRCGLMRSVKDRRNHTVVHGHEP